MHLPQNFTKILTCGWSLAWVGISWPAAAAGSVAEVAPRQPDANSRPVLEVIEVVGRRSHGIRLSSDKILNVAGAGNDPLRALEALPGVVLATPATGGPVARPAVRGSAPVDNEYQTDGLPVGYVFHNDGLSTLNPLLISGFNLYAGSWQPHFQNATGAVIETELRDPGVEPGWMLDAGAIRSALLYDTRISDNAALYLSMRQSFLHLYVDQFIEDEEFDFAIAPRNNDFQAKFWWQPDDANQLRVLTSGAADKVRRRFAVNSRDVAKNPDLLSGEGYASQYRQLGLLWDHEGVFANSQLALNYLRQSDDITEGLQWNLFSDVDEWLVRSKTHSMLQGWADGRATLDWGLQWRQQQISWWAQGRAQPCDPTFASCPPGLYAPLLLDDDRQTVRFASGHLDYRQPAGATLQWSAGLAVDHNDFTGQWFTEPRLSLQWQWQADWQLELTAGRHHQWFRRTELLSAVFGNPDLQLEQAQQFGAVLSQTLSARWRWQLSFYHKTLTDLVVSNPVRQLQQPGSQVDLQLPAFVNGGSGRASGVEFLLNRNLADGWYGWLSVAYSDTRRRNELLQQNFHYEWDLPLVINAVLNYQWDDHWQLGLKWRYQSGRRFTEIFGARPVYPLLHGKPDLTVPPLFYDPTEGEFNGARRAPLHRLDARLDYQTRWGPYPVTLYLEVLNLYARQTVQEQEWNADYSSYDNDYEFPDFPFPGVGVTIRF